MSELPKRASNPHDALFKRTFSDLENARAELLAVLPESIAQAVDFSTLELVTGTFVDELYASTHSDLLYRVKLDGHSVLVYLLFEHQSTVDPLMPLRLGNYVIRILDQHARNHGLPLSPVIPIVLHHSVGGWTACRDFHCLFDPKVLAVPGMHDLVPSFSFLIDDISRATDQELLDRAVSEASRIVPVVLWAMRDARRGEAILTALGAWVGALNRVFRSDKGRDALIEVFRYISWVNDKLTRDDLITVASAVDLETKELVMTLAEQWIAEGEAKGEARGRIEGERHFLEKQLRLKFGELSTEAATRLARADEATLSVWAERVLTATSIDDVVN